MNARRERLLLPPVCRLFKDKASASLSAKPLALILMLADESLLFQHCSYRSMLMSIRLDVFCVLLGVCFSFLFASLFQIFYFISVNNLPLFSASSTNVMNFNLVAVLIQVQGRKKYRDIR